jgi:hypothetical protein
MILLVSHRLIADGDPLWALATGKWIVVHRAVPRVDPFSWTALGMPWVAHEWGYDLLMYLLASRLGYYGLMLLTWAGLAGFYTFLWLLCKREGKNAQITVMVFTIAVSFSGMFVAARPQVFSYFFFAAFLYLLAWRREYRWFLPVLTLFWANLHASVVLGVIMVGFEAAMRFWFERDRSLLPVAGASFMASLVNPNGLGLWHYAIWLSTNPWNRQIAEWRPPDFMSPVVLYPYIAVFLTLGAALYLHDRNTGNGQKTRGMVAPALYLCVFSYQAVTQVRYFPYLLVIWAVTFLRLTPEDLAPPMVLEGRAGDTIRNERASWVRHQCTPVSEKALHGPLGASAEWTKRAAWKNLRRVEVPLILLAMFAVWYGVVTFPGQGIAANLSPGVAPVGAVGYIETHGLTNRLFNYYTWGGYLIYEGIPVFIDGRDDVYLASTHVFQDYVHATKLETDPDAVFRRYGVQTVLLPKNMPLTRYLEAEPQMWKEVYRGKMGEVFVNATQVGARRT